MMKTSDLGLAIAFLAATGFITTHAVATETQSAPNVVAGRENNVSDDTTPPVQQHRARSAPTRIAEGGSDKLLERRVAEGGSDKLLERRVAEGGSDKLLERRVAEGGADRMRERGLAEGGSDRLIERRVADSGYSYNARMTVAAHFSMD